MAVDLRIGEAMFGIPDTACSTHTHHFHAQNGAEGYPIGIIHGISRKQTCYSIRGKSNMQTAVEEIFVSVVALGIHRRKASH